MKTSTTNHAADERAQADESRAQQCHSAGFCHRGGIADDQRFRIRGDEFHVAIDNEHGIQSSTDRNSLLNHLQTSAGGKRALQIPVSVSKRVTGTSAKSQAL